LISNVKWHDQGNLASSSAEKDAEVLEIDDFDVDTDQETGSCTSPKGRAVSHSHSASVIDPDSGLRLSNRRPARASAPIKRYAPVEFESNDNKKRISMQHYDECFLCDEGGDLVTCDICPHVYHLDCVGLKALPKGLWRCPWHACSECEKSSTKAEGVLFHCMTCPLTFCFECAPECYTVSNTHWSACAVQKVAFLQKRGMTCPKSYRFFLCDECTADKRATSIAPKPKASPKFPKVAKPKIAAVLGLSSPAISKASDKADSALSRQLQVSPAVFIHRV
jgi:hypothetical protein